MRRTHLSEALVSRAGRAGVDLRFGVAARALTADGIETGRGRVRARWVVGADGLHSRLRHWAGLAAPPGRYRRFGVRRHYALRPWAQHVEVHWTAGCEAYVTPAGRECVGVAMLWSGARASFDEHLARFPALRERLAGAPPMSRDRGAGPLHQRARGAVRGRVALVGDAAGYLDALTGEGIALGLREARALADAVAAGDLRALRPRPAPAGATAGAADATAARRRKAAAPAPAPDRRAGPGPGALRPPPGGPQRRPAAARPRPRRGAPPGEPLAGRGIR